jgi:hypothetical protein
MDELAVVVFRGVLFESSYISIVEIDMARYCVVAFKDHGHRWPTVSPANSSLLIVGAGQDLFAFDIRNIQHFQAFEATYFIAVGENIKGFHSDNPFDWFEEYLS